MSAASSEDALTDLVRRHRSAAGLTQTELAERSRLSVRMIRDLENGRTRHPRRESVRLLALALRLDQDDEERLQAAAAPPAADPANLTVPPTAPPVPAMLPMAATHFAGRRRELAELDSLADAAATASDAPVVAIIGPGGIGKTSLAVRWAHTAVDRFPDGQLFVDLRGFHPDRQLRPDQALARLLFALGVPNDRIPADEDSAAALFRSVLHGRRMLVVLDNAQSTDQVRSLLPAEPGCFTVVTSRARLTGMVVETSAHRLGLDPLPPAVGVKLVARIIGRDRVDGEPDAVRDLVSVCGGLPLALSIAAANLADRVDLSIAEYVRYLRGGNRLIGIRAGDDGPALRPAFELSYTMLAEPTRSVFRCIGLVPGPDFTAAAVAAMCDMPVDTAAGHLDRLVETHLVLRHGPDRYAVHDLLRLYARQLATAPDTATVDNLLGYYIRCSRAAADVLYPQMLRLSAAEAPDAPAPDGPVPDGSALAPAATDGPADIGPMSADDAKAWLSAEIHNLVAACLHAADHGPYAAGWLIADALRGYFWQRHNATDWQLTARAAERAADRAGDLRARTAVQVNLGHLQHLLRNSDASMRHFSAAIDLARLAGWLAGESTATGNLATNYSDLGHYRQAVDLFRHALELHRAAGFRLGEATVLGNLGYGVAVLGDLDLSLDLLRQALAVHRELDSVAGQAVVLTNLSGVEIDAQRIDDADRHAREALTLARRSGRVDTETLALLSISTVHRHRDELDAALRTAAEAVDITSRIDGDKLRSEALATLALAQSAVGDHDAAVDGLRQALRLAQRMGHQLLAVQALLGLATAYDRAGAREAAVRSVTDAVTVSAEHEFGVLLARAVCLATELGTEPGTEPGASG